MQVWVKVEHYLPTGYACVFVIQNELVKRLTLYVNRPEKECERAIRKVIRQMEKLEVGQQMTCWATHKLDQFVAEQRRWDSRKEASENDGDY
jgi:hypothetical protein